jgi:anti-sigma regulatory factor (Ser/Thr protein kinase)
VDSATLSLRVPADASRLSGNLEKVRAFLRTHRVDVDTTWDIVVCVHESCANAILHGGSPDDIDVVVSIGRESVAVSVIDNGSGLDLDRCHPRRPPDTRSTCGRGLFIMAQLMDEFDISVDGGTELRMLKRLPPALPRRAA